VVVVEMIIWWPHRSGEIRKSGHTHTHTAQKGIKPQQQQQTPLLLRLKGKVKVKAPTHTHDIITNPTSYLIRHEKVL
jgi:hypothetical protein